MNTKVLNPIEAAVMPLKTDAVQRAHDFACKLVNNMTAALVAAGWDLEKAAPVPSYHFAGSVAYARAKLNRQMMERITKWDTCTRRPGMPLLVHLDSAKVERFTQDAREEAAAQYDAFVAKLVQKIGPTTSATLRGSHVWGYSVLTVEVLGGHIERWKTQQIVNVSKLGKIFNQWPSRKVK